MEQRAGTTKQVLLALAIGAAVIVVFALVKFLKISAAIAEAESRGMPPESVTSLIAEPDTWSATIDAVGSLAAVQGVTLAAEVQGRVDRIAFTSGAMVQKGDVLVELDSSVEEAEMRSAAAEAELANLTLKRARALREQNANSVADLEKAELEHRSAAARVETLRAEIARRRIIAPFTGHVGIRMVNEGQIVQPGTPVVSLQSFDPIYIDFTLPQQAVRDIAVGNEVRLNVDTYPKTDFVGKITALDPHVDPDTRNIAVQGTIPNPENKLRPGMFASVTVVLPKTERAITIPSSSITYAPYGDTVWLIETMKDPKGQEYLGVRQQVVKTGPVRGDQVAILSGIKEGEQVVTSGGFKLRPGAPVVVNNSVMPSNEAAPTPADT